MSSTISVFHHCIVIVSYQCILSSPQPESGPTQEPLRSKTDAGRISFTASSAAAAFVRAQVIHYCPQSEEVPTLQMFIRTAITILHCWFPVITTCNLPVYWYFSSRYSLLYIYYHDVLHL